jgi:hypothetical protein
MVDYGLVSRSISGLADRVGNITAQDQAHQRAMKGFDIQKTGLGLRAKEQAGQQDVELAKAEKEAWDNEYVLGEQAIDTHPKWTPEQKAAMKKTFEPFLAFSFKRKEWGNAIRDLKSEYDKEQGAERRHKENVGLKKQENSLRAQQATATAKDTRSTMQKEVEYMAEVNKTTPQEALVMWQKQKSLGERIRLFNNEIDALNSDMTLMGPKGAELKKQKIAELRSLYIPDADQQGTDLPPLPPGFQLD